MIQIVFDYTIVYKPNKTISFSVINIFLHFPIVNI